jgi:hypothetical protein
VVPFPVPVWVDPPDAVLKLGGNPLSFANGKVWLKLQPGYDITLSAQDGKAEERRIPLSLRQALGAFSTRKQLEWLLWYDVEFTSLKTPDITVKIRKEDRPFERDFLQETRRLELEPAGTENRELLLHFSSGEETGSRNRLTRLPFGKYTFMAMREGFEDLHLPGQVAIPAAKPVAFGELRPLAARQ